MNTETAVILGILAGKCYFDESEKGQVKESNCSYLAPASTDWLAIAAGAILIQQGSKHGAPMVAFIGAAVLTIHQNQYAHYKENQ